MVKIECVFGVLCDSRKSMILKRELYRIVITSAILCGSNCWAFKKQYAQKMCLAKMRMLR